MTAPNNKIIALDVGGQRIGVAVASLIARLPEPYGVIKSDHKVIKSICDLVDQQQAMALVIGLPRGLDGQDTNQTKSVREFADGLRQVCNLPIYFQDEALTSKKAEQELNQRRVRYNKGAVDALAATYILTDFLQEHPEIK